MGYAYGLSYSFIHEYYKSIECYDHALELNSQDLVLFENIAFSYFELGDIDNAIFYYKEALRVEPENLPNLKKLGNIYLSLKKDLLQAHYYFNKVLSLDPADNETKELIEYCLKEIH